MDRISAAEAARSLADLARRVADEGETVVIEADGRPLAALMPLSELRRSSGRAGEPGLAKRALEIGGLGYWIWDNERDCYEICSEELARLLGYSLDAYLATHATYRAHLDHIHPDDRARYAEVIAEARAQARGYDLEFRDLGPEGHYRYLRERGEPVLGVDGALIAILGTLQDVSDYKRTEAELREARDHLEQVVAQRTAAFQRANQALRDSEARLKAFIDHSPALISIKDTGGRYLLVNRSARLLYGIDPEFAVGKRVGDVMPQAVAAEVEAMDREVLETGEPRQREIRAPRGGEWRTFDVTKFPFREDSGAALGIGTVVIDITERKQAEEALRESNERFRSVVDSSPTAIFLKDTQGRFLRVNRRFETWYGRRETEVVGKTSRDLFPQAYAQLYTEMDDQVLASGEICERECLVPFADGRDRLVLVTKFPVREPDGRISSIGTINTDLSDRQQAQQRLRESEQRLSLAVQLSKLGHWIWDVASDRCLFCSLEHARLYGLSVERFTEQVATRGQRFAMVHPEDCARVEASFAALRAGERIELEYRVVTPQQAVRHVREIVEALAGPDGATVQEHGVTQDVTEQKLAEDRLYQAQKMEAVGQLTGGIAHDFNNLLAIIQGNAELLSEELESGKPEVEEILDAVLRGAALTQRLLAYSRRQPLHPLPVHLGRLVIGMAPLLERTLGEAIEVRTRVPDDLWIVTADGGQVESALLNLAINARDAMSAGGRLTVECRNQPLDAGFVARHPEASPGDHVVLSVGDTGSGMSPEVLAHAFEPFFTTKEIGQGSGLGLSMVYGFARQSGGYAAIESEEGRGTTVRLFLPRSGAAMEESAGQAADGEVPRGRNEMVLLLEDNPAVRALDRRVLVGLGYRVLEAATARQAGSLMASGEVDLLLSDVILPGGVSGPQFAEQARRRDPALKVVFMSGYPAESATAGGLLGPDQILLNKPFRRHDLACALRRALGP